MNASKKPMGSDFAKVDAYANGPADYDEIPEITEADAARGTIHENGKPVRGRPPLGDKAKTPVTIRLDHDIVAHYRSLGTGWQGKINAVLRKTLET